jgi:cytochrome c oxidase assembly factor CtaG
MRLRHAATALTLWATTAAVAAAHGGEPHGDLAAPEAAGPRDWDELWRAWAFEPLIVVPLVLSGWLYARGVRRLWLAAGAGHGVRKWEAACFAGGLLALAVALVSPLHPWGNVLFSAHMAQHELLMLVSAPLLVLGKPAVAMLKALPPGRARRLVALTRPASVQTAWRAVTTPLAAWLLHAVVLWVWHVPVLFTAALRSEFVHAIQHVSFLASALLFWWAVTHGPRRATGYGAAVLYMLTTAMHSGILGALITLAATVWYPDYLAATASWGLTPLEDQQLGGLVMWVPACAAYIVAGLAFFAAWLRASDRSVRTRECLEGQPA